MKKINNLQFITIFIIIFTSSFLGIELYTLLNTIYLDITLSILLSLLIIPIFIKIFITIFNYQNKFNIKEKLSFLFNKYTKYIIIILLSIYTLIYSIILFYDLNNFIISQFLSETPIFIIAILFSILFSYLTSKDYSSIIHLSNIFFFINLLLIFTIFISNLKGFDLNNLKPILTNGYLNPLKGLLIIISFSIIPIFSLLLIPKNTINNPNITKNLTISIIISYIFIVLTTIFTIGILSIYLSTKYQYPTYIALKNINLFNVFDRIENIIITGWIFQLFITISFNISYISKLLNINNNIVISIILLITIILFNNTNLFYNILPTIFIYLSFIILFIYIFIFIKIKRKN